VAGVLLLGAVAASGDPAVVRVDHVQVLGGGRHEAWVSVLDPQGGPVPGLTQSSFRVEEDRRPVPLREVQSYVEIHPRSRWAILVDSELLERPEVRWIEAMLTRVGRGMGARDRLRIVGLGGAGRVLETEAQRLGEVLGRLPGLASGEPSTPLYDALHREVRRAASAGRSTGGAVWLVTRGAQTGSRLGPADVLAGARARGRRVPVIVLLLEPPALAAEAERLGALADRSGGFLTRVSSPELLASEGLRARERLMGGYRLRFTPAAWSGGAARHELEVTVTQAGVSRTGIHAFEAADVTVPSGVLRLLSWLVPLLLVVGVLGVLVVRRGLRVCRLRVATGEEKDFVWEIYALPVSLGAVATNDIVCPDVRVSRHHALIERGAGGLELVDLNSENGTFVNGERVVRRRLQRGDRVGLGGVVELRVEGR
jgi:hypothetical protein